MMRLTQFLALLMGMALVLVVPTMARNTAPPVDSGETTQITYCTNVGSTTIPDNNNEGITSTIEVMDDNPILDLNVVLSVTHTRMGDIGLFLTNGDDRITLIDRPNGGNCSGDDLDDNIADDEGNLAFENGCSDSSPAYVPGDAYRAGDPASNSLLATYDGRTTEGVWSLNAQDRRPDREGQLRQWCLQFTVPDGTPIPNATPTPTSTPIPPTATPTEPLTATPTNAPPTATPTEPPLPTNTPTPTPTDTPDVPPTVTPTPTITPTPNPDTRYSYGALMMRGFAAGNCQSVENESLFPNNTIGEARDTRPLCRGRAFQGVHDTENREDIFRFVVGDSEAGLYRFALNVPDINLSLRLYDNDVNEVAFSTNPDTEDEQFEIDLTPGTYFVRVYRADENISDEPYRLTITP